MYKTKTLKEFCTRQIKGLSNDGYSLGQIAVYQDLIAMLDENVEMKEIIHHSQYMLDLLRGWDDVFEGGRYKAYRDVLNFIASWEVEGLNLNGDTKDMRWKNE